MQQKSVFGRLSFGLTVSLVTLLLGTTVQAASPWPASPTGTQIASGLTALNTTSDGFEASGVAYLSGYGYIINGDDGDLAVVSDTGTVLHYWFPNGDLEDMTLTGTSAVDHIVYLANETGSKIEAFNLDTGTKVVNKSWTLSDLPINGGLGMESLAYVPAAYAPASWGTALSGGFFVAASQAEALLRVYNINTNNNGATITSVAQIPVTYTDVAGLHYNPLTQLLYVIFDSADNMKEYTLTGNIVNSYTLPAVGASDEGIVIVPDCANGKAKIAITNDAVSSFVTVYNNFPITCPATTPTVIDNDNDGFANTVDCNDNDFSVHTNQTYYRDADGDGLGNPNSFISVCSSTVPAGYVTNSNDTNDNPIVAVLPDIPTNLSANTLALRKVVMSWNGNGKYYTLRLVDTWNKKTTTFNNLTDMSKVLGSDYVVLTHNYKFSVRACNVVGCSNYSDSVSFTPRSLEQLNALKRNLKR